MESHLKWLIFAIIGVIVLHTIFTGLGVNLSLSNQQSCPVTSPVPTVTQKPTVTPPKNNSTSNSTSSKPTYTLYFFEQPNCPYCTEMSPKVTAWALDKDHASRIDLQNINTWENSALPSKYAVHTTPTTVLVNKVTGAEVKRWVGVFDINELDCYFHAH